MFVALFVRHKLPQCRLVPFKAKGLARGFMVVIIDVVGLIIFHLFGVKMRGLVSSFIVNRWIIYQEL